MQLGNMETLSIHGPTAVTSFRGILYNKAVTMGLKVKVRTRPKMGKVRFSFFNPSVVAPPETPKEPTPIRVVVSDECLSSFPTDINTFTSETVSFGDGL